MTFVALLTVCLVAVPTECKVQEILLTERMPVMLEREAQTRAIEWLEKHPAYVKSGLRVVVGRAA